MKTRPVIVTLELDSPYSVHALRSALWWSARTGFHVVQAQANVIRQETKKKPRRKA